MNGATLRIVASSILFSLAFQSAQAQAAAEQGLKIIASRELGNCISCHSLAGLKEAGRQGNFGPPLDGVGARYSAERLRQWVVDPRQFKPDTLMPPFGSINGLQRPNQARPLLSPEQIDQVTAALAASR
jgi:L-cysteine S-thiosulfotransferase